MLINQLRTVDDLAIGGRAEPEPGVRYQLRTIDDEPIDAGDVTEVVRNGNVLSAVTACGPRRQALHQQLVVDEAVLARVVRRVARRAWPSCKCR